jgi:uncharacterized protein (TIGR02145 family)
MLFAQNGVTVSNLAVSVGSPTTVTFNVSWKNTGMPALWSDTVWVFVDYNNAGKMERLPLLPGATLTETSAPGIGSVEYAPNNNDQGVWVAGNARTEGSFSATVKLLTEVKDVGGACVYGSNYPPVGEYKNNATEISFTGTPMYEILLAKSGGENATVKSGNTFLLPCDYTLTSFTDATGAPGIMNCVPMIGNIDFIASFASKNQQVSFVVSSEPNTPNPALITYSWSAPDFSPATYEGTTFTSTAPETPGMYSITLTAHAEDYYCDLVKVKNVEVEDCTAPGSTVNFTEFYPCSNATTGDYWFLTDERESNNIQTYKVKKMADGKIWMVQDLKFGDKCDKATFSWLEGVNLTDNVTSLMDKTYYGDCINATNSSTPPNRGYLYNWAAAINKLDAYYGSNSDIGCSGTSSGSSGTNPGACQGICPTNWHIPTGESTGEFNALHKAFGNCSSFMSCWGPDSAWEGVLGGAYLEPGWLESQGAQKNVWTSTYASNTHARRFYTGYSDPGNGSDKKYRAFAVRCVMNY